MQAKSSSDDSRNIANVHANLGMHYMEPTFKLPERALHYVSGSLLPLVEQNACWVIVFRNVRCQEVGPARVSTVSEKDSLQYTAFLFRPQG